MTTERCLNHPGESATACFSCYLSQPCDECERTADHNGLSKATGKRGKFCSSHCDFDKYARARND